MHKVNWNIDYDIDFNEQKELQEYFKSTFTLRAYGSATIQSIDLPLHQEV